MERMVAFAYMFFQSFLSCRSADMEDWQLYTYTTFRNSSAKQMLTSYWGVRRALEKQKKEPERDDRRETWLKVLLWQCMLWIDFRVYIHGTRKRQYNSMEMYLQELQDEYARQSVQE